MKRSRLEGKEISSSCLSISKARLSGYIFFMLVICYLSRYYTGYHDDIDDCLEESFSCVERHQDSRYDELRA